MAEAIAQPIRGERVERARGEVPDTLPVVLRSAVHVTVSKGRFRPPWSKRIVLCKWVISGEAEMRISGRRYPILPNHLAIHLPTSPHEFWSIAPATDMCWFSLDGPLVEQFVTMLGLQAGVYPWGPPPVDAIHELMDSLRNQTLEGRRHSSALAMRQLYDIVSRMPPPKFNSVVRQVRHLIQEGLADPELSAKGIASKLNYNRGSLSRMFHQQTGTTIMDCITQTRLEEAEMLLRQTEDRVGDIARKCGFSNVSYFTRWVKRHTGRLPHHLRDTTS